MNATIIEKNNNQANIASFGRAYCTLRDATNTLLSTMVLTKTMIFKRIITTAENQIVHQYGTLFFCVPNLCEIHLNKENHPNTVGGVGIFLGHGVLKGLNYFFVRELQKTCYISNPMTPISLTTLEEILKGQGWSFVWSCGSAKNGSCTLSEAQQIANKKIRFLKKEASHKLQEAKRFLRYKEEFMRRMARKFDCETDSCANCKVPCTECGDAMKALDEVFRMECGDVSIKELQEK